MSARTRRRLWSLLGAGAVSTAAVWATFAVATASARSVQRAIYPRNEGYQQVGRLWTREAPPPRAMRPSDPHRFGYRRDGRLWIKDGARRAPLGGPLTLVLTKTVGLDPNLCATTDSVAVPSGTEVTYCFEATNTSGVTLVSHDLFDDQLGPILTMFSYDLVPGANVFVTATATITNDVVNTGTWTARDATGAQTSAFDTATVTLLVSSIALTKTVGLDPSACAATDTLAVPTGTDVTYCYRVTNTGPVTLGVHDLTDDQLGTILSEFAYELVPGANVFVTQTTTITSDVINLATWTAYNLLPSAPQGPVDVAMANDTASVTTSIPVELVEFEVE